MIHRLEYHFMEKLRGQCLMEWMFEGSSDELTIDRQMDWIQAKTGHRPNMVMTAKGMMWEIEFASESELVQFKLAWV